MKLCCNFFYNNHYTVYFSAKKSITDLLSCRLFKTLLYRPSPPKSLGFLQLLECTAAECYLSPFFFFSDILFSWATWERGCATAIGGGEGWPGRQRGRRTICHRRRDYCGRLSRSATGNVWGLQGGQASWWDIVYK